MITPHLLILLTDLMISLETPSHLSQSEGWGMVGSSGTLAKGVEWSGVKRADVVVQLVLSHFSSKRSCVGKVM